MFEDVGPTGAKAASVQTLFKLEQPGATVWMPPEAQFSIILLALDT